jgi:hypothetical protein
MTRFLLAAALRWALLLLLARLLGVPAPAALPVPGVEDPRIVVTGVRSAGDWYPFSEG